MKLSTFLPFLAPLAAAQSAAPYTDPKSGISFSTYIDKSGYFFGLTTGNSTTDFIGIIGAKGTGWSGVSLGGAMLGKLLIVAWPNGQSIVSSFRKTPSYGSPPVVTGTFAQTAIANGTYVNSTHWTYTFLCTNCIQTDQTTFAPTDKQPVLGYAFNSAAPSAKTNPASAVAKHTAQGNAGFDLTKTKTEDFEMWKSWAAKAKEFVA